MRTRSTARLGPITSEPRSALEAARTSAEQARNQAVADVSPDRAPDNPNHAALAETRIALVIGNGTYANVKALKNADSDAANPQAP